jgi:molybdate transport system substrate-binding protein
MMPAWLGVLLPLIGWPGPATAKIQRAEVHVACAANFANVQARLSEVFTRGSGHTVVVSTGSSGQLYAQIRNGAPFDVFLSADSERPARLEQDSFAVARSRFVYALGRLALYGPGLDSVRAGGVDLRDARYRTIAIANPATAPYGDAALQVIARLGLRDRVTDRLIRGESIAQTFQFVESRAAVLGFVAYSQVRSKPARTFWLVPLDYHDPISQEAVLLRRGESNPAARAYVEFLKGEVASRVIASFGYATP